MNVPARSPMTLASFLEWEERQPLRYEFDGFAPVAMTGGSMGHAQIQRNLAVSLTNRLRGKPCQFVGSDLKFLTADDRIRYPDGMVVCTPVARTAKMVRDPVIVFEVLSPSMGGNDRIVKAREYQATPSVRRYVMLEQDSVAAAVYIRGEAAWTFELLVADSSLVLPEIGVELPLAELYEGVDFSE